MEDAVMNGVKERLIQAGLHELLLHGKNDFSLRRVALGAQVSCAAPYRHFKDKDELIRAIIAYIREDYTLLCDSVGSIFGIGSPESVVELAVAGVRVWIAGGNFPSFLESGELSSFDEPLTAAVNAYAERKGLTPERTAELRYLTLSAFYGTVTLIISERYTSDEALASLRHSLRRFIEV